MESQLVPDKRLNHMETVLRDEEAENNITSNNPITEYIPSVYSERTVITIQPHCTSNTMGMRDPMPVPTVSGWNDADFGFSSYIPLTGLQFLAGVEELHIQQTVELHDLLAKIESENRYIVKTANGETLYVGAEESSSCQRLCFGSGRTFSLILVDLTRQPAIHYHRRLACSSGIFGCFLQRLDAYVPSGDFLGSIEQEWTVLIPSFVIKDEYSKQLYYMTGPRACVCAMYTDATFQVTNAETGVQVASISHSWDHSIVNYNLSVTFPSHFIENKHKALLVGAALLLEYMFFERAKKAKCCSCC